MRSIKTLLLMLVLFVGAVNAQDLVLEGNVTSNVTLQADKTYLLKGFVRIQEGASLTVPAGTVIYGDYNSQGSLIVLPGGKIFILGTAENPVVFTSQFKMPGSTQTPNYGDWGGIIILGKAPINVPGGTAKIEGPGDFYGGTDPEDNSGIIRYCRIEYPGIAFSPNNEINGLTFGAVGRGTTVDHVQVSYSGDDSFEWFGGTVNAKYLIAYRGWDDDFDTDFGFSGKLQFLLGVRDPQISDVSQSNGFESDNDGSGSVNEPRTSPTWYNVTLIGPSAETSSTYNSLYRRGMHLRRSSQNKVNNALVMGWPTGIYVDGTNTIADAKSGISYIKNSIIAGTVGTALSSTDATFESEMSAWFTTNGGRVLATNSEVMLTEPYNLSNPNAMPKAGSPVFTGGATPPKDGFFDASANYVGAFGYTDWTKGWSSFNFTVPEKPTDVIAGDITTNVTLQAGTDYTLVGFVRVAEGGSLTIPAGTKIYGDYNSQGSLIVLPGGKIYAEGAKDNPIVFTSQFTKAGSTQSPNYGDWGGIILLGKAPINVPGGTAKIEGPGDYYGGTDPNDNSGVMKYVRIEYPGIAFSPNNEINGLTFGGVGRGTIIDHIQVSYSGDDSFEWFGGTVNAKHLIAYRGWDDDFDTDFGYSGKLQFLLGVRDPQISDVSQSNGFESDNDGSGSVNEPRTSPTWWNVTLVGPAKDSSTPINSLYRRGMHLRRSSQNKVGNTIILGWPTGLYIDGTNTVADAKTNVSYFNNSIIAGSVTKQLSSTDAEFESGMAAWFGANNGKLLTTTAELYLADPFNLDNPNAMPIPPMSPAFTGGATPPNDGFFDATSTFIGAFGREDWTDGWSSFKFEIPTSVKEEFENEIPSTFELSQNYPNPFNPSTSIKFSLPQASMVKLSVYNILGQEVANLINSYKESGNYTINWNASNLSSGMYIYRLETGSQIITKKMTLLK